jgi:uncharacterized Zn finger protein
MSAKAAATPFAALTWDDVEAWAGSSIVSRGKGYHRSNRVQQLAQTASGGLIAWVQGTRRYATQVEIVKKKLSASCTCPYGITCKHAVAVVLTYLDTVKNQKKIPTVTNDDPRLDLLTELAEARAAVYAWEPQDDEDYDEAYNDDDYDDEDEDGEDEERDKPIARQRIVAKRPQPPVSDGATTYLEQQSKEELIALLKTLMRQHPDVRQAIVDRANLLSGEVKKLVSIVRKEIRTLAGMPGWDDDDGWGRGTSDNYNRIRTHMEALLAAGHADEVLSLGQELLQAGTQHVEMINDEGETQGEVVACMDIVFRALDYSSLSLAEQMLWALDAELDDSYDLCQG